MDLDQITRKLAQELSSALITRERANNPDDLIYVLRDGSPDWMREIILDLPGDSLDTTYEFANRAAGTIADSGDDIEESIFEMEADVYTSDLTAWLHQHPAHVDYITEALEEFGGDFSDGFALLAMAQYKHIQEVAHALHTALSAYAESRLTEQENMADLVEDIADNPNENDYSVFMDDTNVYPFGTA